MLAALMSAFAVAYAFVRRGGSLFSRVFFKSAASVMFVLVAYSLRIGASQSYYILIICGLCAALLGDITLLFTDRGNGFLMTGMAAFAAAHLFYIIAFWTIAAASWVDAVFFAALLTLGASLAYGLYIKAGRNTVPLYIYAALVCAMVARAVSMLWVPEAPVLFGVFAATGGVLFAASDLLLAAEHQTGSKVVGGLSTIVYYAAQALIAFTVLLAP